MVIEDPPTIMQDLDLVAAQAGRSTSMKEPGVVLTELAHPEGEALPPVDAQVPVLSCFGFFYICIVLIAELNIYSIWESST
jgi:hypothetical protein